MISSRSGLHEARSIHYRGDFMNGLKGIGCRALGSMAVLSGAIFTLLLVPAYGQQDINPTWYDPAPTVAAAHPAQPAAAVHSSQLPTGPHRNQQTAKVLSSAPATTQLKNTKLDQGGHDAAHKSTAAPSGELASVALPESR
jgi:hypothetical protein